MCKNHCIKTSLRCQFVSTFNEVSGESCVRNNVVTTADYNNVTQICNALFHQREAVRERNSRTVFLYCKNNYFVTVASSFFNYGTMTQSKGITVHNDCRTFFTVTCAQDATNAFQIFFQSISTGFQQSSKGFSHSYFFKANVFKNFNIFRFSIYLVTGYTTTIRFDLQVANDTTSQTSALISHFNRNISHYASAQRTSTDKFIAIIKTHGIVNVTGKSQIKAFQEFNNLSFFFRVSQINLAFCNHNNLLLNGTS